ncbi:hypothetical protein B0I35DRAFT_418060 [Stachybotrys elegans]|uniref:Zn(2)-C6 fungal-type domain-containing protein n=1 Tax=Stachybotrys elegans TaxID=80388 RepID=A0A8K0T5X9_9HYPO|nr:hypothetical protein B0I35DRAFT_418060 [Stachybotrys elegans]
MDNKSSKSPGNIPKHRACDECRSRKLACSKEPDGCARCKRERIKCHYSPQKPMGRPRKKRLVENPPPEPRSVDAPAAVANPGESQDNFVGYNLHMDYSGEHANFDLLVPASSHHHDMEFLDLLPSESHDGFSPAAHSEPHVFMSSNIPMSSAAFPTGFEGGLDMSIDIHDPNYEFTNASKHYGHSLGNYMSTHALLSTEPPESTPSELSNASPEPLPQSSVHTAAPNVNCGCLSSLYLTLDALANLPSNIMGAMRMARNASRTAHEVINCYTCSAPFRDLSSAPPIQSFQSLMCLGALVPTVCNAYARILDMVDKEVESAHQQRRLLWFAFKDVGGLWSHLSQSSCMMIQPYDNTNMDPQTWRRLIRGIIRLDIYGVADACESEDKTPYGLKDVVRQLDERSRRRHDVIDELITRGELGPTFCGQPYTITPHEQRPCVRILDAARMALDRMVIA